MSLPPLALLQACGQGAGTLRGVPWRRGAEQAGPALVLPSTRAPLPLGEGGGPSPVISASHAVVQPFAVMVKA